MTGAKAEDVELSSFGQPALMLHRHVELRWPDVELTNELQGLARYVDWVVVGSVRMIGRRWLDTPLPGWCKAVGLVTNSSINPG